MPYRHIPSVETLATRLEAAVPLPKALVINFTRQAIEHWRKSILEGATPTREEIENDISDQLKAFAASRLQPVINATGVLIHTNLGRSPLGTTTADALKAIATGYTNLEFNLPDGTRGKRAGYLETAIACLLEAPAATAVNNCAAALVLILRSLSAMGKNEVIVSRGELVEIGGGFRIPEILETSGCKLVEVGATNKTHLHDYEQAISPQTALILKVHRSNFRLSGFTTEPSAIELAELAHAHELPLVEDIGSGAMMHTDELAPIDHEPTPQQALKNGIDLVCFSGDKLLGGPQSGIIAGRADLVAAVKKEPFFRAVRCDKLILAALQESIDEYLRTKAKPEQTDIPTLRHLATPVHSLRQRATAMQAALGSALADITLCDTLATTGGGTMPDSQIPSIALRIVPQQMSTNRLSTELRTGSPAIVGYTENNALNLDLRTVFEHQDSAIIERLSSILA